MLDKKEFRNIEREISESDRQREILIKKSRDILKLSKQLIYSLHRNNLNEADKLVNNVQKEKQNLDRIANKYSRLLYEGSYSEALQEYAEALSYYAFIKGHKIPNRASLKVNTEDYLMGICDLTGELARKAVALAVKRDYKGVLKIKDLVEELYGEFLKFNLRNNQLRKKSDSIKWNLKKIEEIMYDIRQKK